jgi:hypothetical protein
LGWSLFGGEFFAPVVSKVGEAYDLVENAPDRKSRLRRSVMFAVIRHYNFDSKDSAEIDLRIRQDFVPIVKKAQGFVRYYWLDNGKGEGASVGVFKDKAGADESVRLAADYVQKHLSKLLTEKPEIIEGPIKAHD